MTFAAPLALLALAVPVALLAGYLLAQRARQRTAVRFAAAPLLASVLPRRSAAARHLPAAAMLAAVTVLVLAAAEPATTVRVPRQRATIELTIDTSGSMSATDVAPSRLAAAQTAARRFVAGLPAGLQVGLLAFDSTPRVLVAPTAERTPVLAAIDALQIGGGTATGPAITTALDAIRAQPAVNGTLPPSVVVLMSDGTPTIGSGGLDPLSSADAAAGQASSLGVPVDTIAFGTTDGVVTIRGETIAVPYDPQTMQRLARESRGRSFTASSAAELGSVYTQIGRAVGYETHHRDITIWFTVVGLLLTVLAAAGTLVAAQRLA